MGLRMIGGNVRKSDKDKKKDTIHLNPTKKKIKEENLKKIPGKTSYRKKKKREERESPEKEKKEKVQKKREERKEKERGKKEEDVIQLGKSKEEIEEDKGWASISEQLEKPEAKIALGGTAIGVGALVGLGIAAAAGPSTIGGTVLYQTTTGATGTGIATNTATAATTTSLLTKIGFGTGVGVLMGVIGSYPFAGFLKEEALQTLGIATYSAMQRGNLDEAERAIEAQEELLDPNAWDKLFNAVPYVNVLRELKDYYKAAKLKTEIDRELIKQERIKQENGETETEKWDRIRREREEYEEQKRKEEEEYYAEIRRQAEEAKKEERAADEAYWDKIYAEKEAKKKADRKAEQKYWDEVKKEWAKTKENTRPSKLNFGLL